MRTDYSHCCLLTTIFGRQVILEATGIYGVRMVEFGIWQKENKILEEIKIDEKSNLINAVRYCIDQLGDGYSWSSLFGILFRFFKLGKDGENNFNCSELLARAFAIKHKSLDHITVKEFKLLLLERHPDGQ